MTAPVIACFRFFKYYISFYCLLLATIKNNKRRKLCNLVDAFYDDQFVGFMTIFILCYQPLFIYLFLLLFCMYNDLPDKSVNK